MEAGSDQASGLPKLLAHCLDGLDPFELPVADPRLAVVCGRVGDHTRELLPRERIALERTCVAPNTPRGDAWLGKR